MILLFYYAKVPLFSLAVYFIEGYLLLLVWLLLDSPGVAYYRIAKLLS